MASGLGVSLGQFKDNTLEIMKSYNLFKQSVLEASFSSDSTGKAIPVQAYYRSQGFQSVEAPRFPDSWHMKAVRFPALCTGHFYPQEIFLVLIFVKG